MKGSICQNLYKNEEKAIANIPVTKLHRFEQRKSIKSSGKLDKSRNIMSIRFFYYDEVWIVRLVTHLRLLTHVMVVVVVMVMVNMCCVAVPICYEHVMRREGSAENI